MVKAEETPEPKTSQKRKSESDKDEDPDEELSDVKFTPPPKKKQKKVEMDDAAFAAKLQAEENSRARPTRGGATRKTAPVKKRTPKKKAAAKVKASDDSDVESGSAAEKKVNRSGGFHVSNLQLNFCPPSNRTETAHFVSPAVRATRW